MTLLEKTKGLRFGVVLLTETRIVLSIKQLPHAILAAGFLVVGTDCQAQADIELVSNPASQAVFGGSPASLLLTLRNIATNTISGTLRAKVFQVSSATAAAFQELAASRIRLLPGQTIIETVSAEFPTVLTETSFLLQWWIGTNTMIGTSQVSVYPTNLLAALEKLVPAGQLGLFDSEELQGQFIRPTEIGARELAVANLETFPGHLLIVLGHNGSPDFSNAIKALAKRGVAVLWISQSRRRGNLVPSFYVKNDLPGAIVVVQPEMVENLARSPRSQWNFIQLARMALHPEPFDLPELEIEPTGPK